MKEINRREFVAGLSGAGIILASSPLLGGFHGWPAKSESPKILLYSGWNTKNIGDQGHTPGTLYFLETYFPEAAITLWLANTNDETISILMKRFPAIGMVRGRMDRQGKADNQELQEAFDGTDLLIHNSGMSYNSFWPAPSILEACINRDKAICLYGQSFDGFKKEDKEHMVSHLSKAKAIYCRDTESYYYLRKIGVSAPILEFGPDGCFGIDLRNDAKAEAYLKKHGLEPKKYITVTIRTNVSGGATPLTLEEMETGYSGGEREDPMAQVDLWAAKLREVIIHWVKDTGLKVLIVPEVEREIVPGKQWIYDRLPADIRDHVVHMDEWWNMDMACSIYRSAHTVVNLEPHSCIMALANGTPIIHYYSPQHGLKAWMFRDIGLPEWLIDIDREPAVHALEALMGIHHDYKRARAKVKRAMTFVESRSSEAIQDIKKLLG